MRKRLVEYRKRIDALLDGDSDGKNGFDWDDAIQEHLAQISFFQHERLVHLLVTLAFALMEIACVFAMVITQQILVAVLALLLLVLLVPYIVHYRILENETQKLYAQYDRMLEKRRGSPQMEMTGEKSRASAEASAPKR